MCHSYIESAITLSDDDYYYVEESARISSFVRQLDPEC